MNNATFDLNIVQGGGVGWVFDRFGDAIREHVDPSLIITPHAIPDAKQYMFIAPQYAATATPEQLSRSTVMVHHMNPFPPFDFKSRMPILKAARRVVVTNKIMVDLFRKFKMPPPKLIHHGIDIEKFSPGLKGLVGDVFTIGICGRNHADGRKGPKRILEILVQLSKVIPIKVVFNGLGWEPVMIELMKNSANATTWRGSMHYETYPQYYKTLDALLIASEVEGGPYPALEALATGVPVVSTRVGYVPELEVPQIRNVQLYDEPIQAVGMLARLKNEPTHPRDVAATVADWTWASACRRWSEIFKMDSITGLKMEDTKC